MSNGAKTSISAEYLMTVRANLAPRPVTDGLRVLDVTSGEVLGPRIKGELVSPSGDWLRLLPNGIAHLDVRVLIRTDDGHLIYSSYTGVLRQTMQDNERLAKGEMLKDGDFYLVVAPKYETSSEKYGWLNGIQTIGKMVEFQRAGDPHFTYDVFAIK